MQAINPALSDVPGPAVEGEEAGDWLASALASPYDKIWMEHRGCSIEVLSWGEAGNPGILLLHGSRAHARWWIAVAPLLADRFRITALSFAGMGGSAHRESYAVRSMAEEAWAAAAAGGLFSNPQKPIVVAHSFGAYPAAFLAWQRANDVAGVILVDAPVLPHISPPVAHGHRARSYPDLETALGRFELKPAQKRAEPLILQALARAALREDDAGRWSWRYDPHFLDKMDFQNGWDELIQARCRLALIRGSESSVIGPAEEAIQRAALAPSTIFATIRDAGHHIMVDQPRALGAMIGEIASEWQRLGRGDEIAG